MWPFKRTLTSEQMKVQEHNMREVDRALAALVPSPSRPGRYFTPKTRVIPPEHVVEYLTRIDAIEVRKQQFGSAILLQHEFHVWLRTIIPDVCRGEWKAVHHIGVSYTLVQIDAWPDPDERVHV